MLRVLVAKERTPGETRVAATPETVKQLVKAGLEVHVETEAGLGSFISDESYEAAGATIASDPGHAWAGADLVLKVRPLLAESEIGNEAQLLKEQSTLIGFLDPYRNDAMVRTLASRRITSFSLELVPRVTRAQKMDALSSQANLAGYKAVILAAGYLPKYFPLLMTAAGTIRPAKVVVMGAGVAGLQAIATAKRLGAVVEASDIREAVKLEVESLGGKFIPLPETREKTEGAGGYAREVTPEFLNKQREIVQQHVAVADVVITTAQVPGKPAPKLLTGDMVRSMRPGSVVVDLAVEQGGNCELTQPGKVINEHGVLIVGLTNLVATIPADASMLYSRNVLALVLHLLNDAALHFDLDDEITRGTLLTYQGKIFHAPTAERLQGSGHS